LTRDDEVSLKALTEPQARLLHERGADVGWDAVKEVTAGAAAYQLKYSGTKFRKVAVTNRQFTSGAVDHAALNHVNLVQRSQVEDLLGRHPVSNHELDDDVAANMYLRDLAA
jgi:hypothetical protein